MLMEVDIHRGLLKDLHTSVPQDPTQPQFTEGVTGPERWSLVPRVTQGEAGRGLVGFSVGWQRPTRAGGGGA